MYICYCLKPISKNYPTYVGCTNNFQRRIRQHNCEIKGGAKFTTGAVSRGILWTPFIIVEGFISKNEALSFEWHWKNQSRKDLHQDESSLNRRILGLQNLLRMDRWKHIRQKHD